MRDFRHLFVSIPPGAIIGIIGDEGAGQQDVIAQSPAGMVTVFHTLDARDALARAEAAGELDHQRRAGATVLIASHQLEWLASLADEIWWIRDGDVAARGHPREVVEQYLRHLAAERIRRGLGRQTALVPSLRAGDGRAELAAIETLDGAGNLTAAWRTGERVAVRVHLRFREAVSDPVVGILIRTRIGFEVYGTNTELEQAAIGPRAAGGELSLTFTFDCHLCPGDYTVTAASHDPDGVWHDWVQDAIAVCVADHRYTAGVACLRASVALQSGSNER